MSFFGKDIHREKCNGAVAVTKKSATNIKACFDLKRYLRLIK